MKSKQNPCKKEISALNNNYYLSSIIIYIERAGVFSNFNTVLLQFYAQFYSNSTQIYHCKNYITSLYHYHIITLQPKTLCKS